MLRSLRTPHAAVLALALALLTLLPPSGWALCVAPGGHVEVEPVALDAGRGCCGATDPAPAEGVAAAGSDCDSCWDLVAFSGDAVSCRIDDPYAPAPTAWAPAATPTIAPAPANPAPPAPLAAPSPPARHLPSTQLRN